jgi:hypothetical protein
MTASIKLAPKAKRMTATNGWQELGTVESVTYETETEPQMSMWSDGGYRRSMITNRSIRLDFEDGRTIIAPSVKFKQVSDDELEIVLDGTYSFPQRYMLGIDQEDTLARTSIAGYNGRNLTIDGYTKGRAVIGSVGRDSLTTPAATIVGIDIAKAARDLITRVEGGKLPATTYMDDKETVVAGKARVYQAQSEGEAQRNLDFAVANLTSYIRYVDSIKPEQEAKAKEAAEKAQVEAKQAAFYKAGIDLFNKVHGTRHFSWGTVSHAPLSIRDKWSKQAEEVAKLKRESNPFDIGAIQDAINAATLRSSQLRNTVFGF